MMKRKNPTDRVLLNEIYSAYYDEFCAFEKSNASRESKIYVPIDCRLLAKRLGMDPEILFGRLYYHLDKKHGYKQDNGSFVNLFALAVGTDRHAVNFPLLSAIVADLNQSHYRFTIPLVLSVVAIIISIAGYFRVGT